jgi:hypothetical protein
MSTSYSAFINSQPIHAIIIALSVHNLGGEHTIGMLNLLVNADIVSLNAPLHATPPYKF